MKCEVLRGYDFAKRKKGCNFLCGRFIIVNCRTKKNEFGVGNQDMWVNSF